MTYHVRSPSYHVGQTAPTLSLQTPESPAQRTHVYRGDRAKGPWVRHAARAVGAGRASRSRRRKEGVYTPRPTVPAPRGEEQPAQAPNVPRFLGVSKSSTRITPQEKQCPRGPWWVPLRFGSKPRGGVGVGLVARAGELALACEPGGAGPSGLLPRWAHVPGLR